MSIEGVIDKIFYKDARDMSEIPDNSINLMITSPPYWHIKDYQKDGYQQNNISDIIEGQIGNIDSFKEYISTLRLVWSECCRILVPNGKLCINTPLMPIPKKQMNTHYNRDILDINANIEYDILNNINDLHLYDIYIWNRTNSSKKLMFGSYPYPRNFYAQNTSEFITIFVKEGKSMKLADRFDIKDMKKNKSKYINKIKEQSKISEKEWVSFTKQIWDIPIPNKGDSAFGIHCAIMPEEIPKRLIKLFTFVGDIVLDPFTGSGTTLKVAKQEGRHYIGYEINKSYQSIINEKIKETMIKLEIFS